MIYGLLLSHNQWKWGKLEGRCGRLVIGLSFINDVRKKSHSWIGDQINNIVIAELVLKLESFGFLSVLEGQSPNVFRSKLSKFEVICNLTGGTI